jgi:hypothetical protein
MWLSLGDPSQVGCSTAQVPSDILKSKSLRQQAAGVAGTNHPLRISKAWVQFIPGGLLNQGLNAAFALGPAACLRRQ